MVPLVSAGPPFPRGSMMRPVNAAFDATDYGTFRPIDVVASPGICSSVLRISPFALRVLLPALGAAGAAAGAQERAPVDGGRVISLGQPRSWSWTAGVASGSLSGGGDAPAAAQARLAGFHAIGNPVVGALGLQLEAYAGARARAMDGGVRARLLMPVARIGVGAEFDATHGRTRALYSFVIPGRRGGLFGDGTVARLDYVPARGNSLTAAIEVPIFREVDRKSVV